MKLVTKPVAQSVNICNVKDVLKLNQRMINAITETPFATIKTYFVQGYPELTVKQS